MSLFEQVRRKLRVSYEDDETDERITEIMDQADFDLRSMLGISDPRFTFEDPGPEQSLFLSYCFYEWNDALDDFAVSFEAKIAQVRDKWLAKEWSHAQEASTAEL